jgi:hypothetical protein
LIAVEAPSEKHAAKPRVNQRCYHSHRLSVVLSVTQRPGHHLSDVAVPPGRVFGDHRVVRAQLVVALNLLVGAILTVLPLPILPFIPEQTAGHYLAHFIYLVTQVPAVVLLWRLRPARVAA